MAGTMAAPVGSAEQSTPDQPQGQGRVESLDLIRGIAVMGIVIANATSLGALTLLYVWPTAEGPIGLGETIVWLLQYMFIDGKMRGVFALLFGIGMAIFIERARAKGGRAYILQARRLFWLFLFGVLHFFLLFTGDVLQGYAVAGLVALLFLWMPPKWLVGIAATLFVAYTYFPLKDLNDYRNFEASAMAAPPGAEVREEYEAEIAEGFEKAHKGEAALTQPLYFELVSYRIGRGYHLFDHPEYWLPEYGLLMLMGVGLYRMGLFAGAIDRRKLLWFGGAGIVLSAIAAIPFGLWALREDFPPALSDFVFYGPSLAKNLPMILGYVAVLAALAPSILATGLGERIAAAGRMAFSNYIGTSLVGAIIFQGWGFGLFNHFDRLERMGFVLFIWVLMLLWSKPWLERFRFGPLEWAWRCLTYWKLFPIRR